MIEIILFIHAGKPPSQGWATCQICPAAGLYFPAAPTCMAGAVSMEIPIAL